ncbi:MAG: hypothetical protein C0397_19280 [Odoribacter sp.]|nr:hypothetical protein [Odoribacter sp.]
MEATRGLDTDKDGVIDEEDECPTVFGFKENNSYNVNITGYDDSQGTDDYNLNLSKNRTSSVVKAITASKINKKRITSSKGLGETNPAATNDTEEGRALNRRVEFEVIKAK